MNNKRGMEMQTLIYLLVAIFVLVLAVIAIGYFRSKGVNILDYVFDVLRFGK